MKATVGHSEDMDSEDAVAEVLEQCAEKLESLVGFHAHGEIGPGRQGDGTTFHGEMLASVLFGDA